MAEEHHRISGQIVYKGTLHTLDTLFTHSDLLHEVRESWHYNGHEYLRISLDEKCVVKVEDIGSEEFLFSGAGENKKITLELCESLSAVCAKQLLKHRIEVYDSVDEIAYYHYDWSRE